MTREELAKALARAVKQGAITQTDADLILARFDDGSLDVSTLPPDVRDSMEGKGSLTRDGAILALALILLARVKAPAGRVWRFDPVARRYTAPAPVRLPPGTLVLDGPTRPRPGGPPAAAPLGGVTIPAGRLTPEQTRAVVDVVLDRAEAEMVTSAARLSSSSVSLAEWFRTTEDMIAERQIMAAAAAKGGIRRLTEADREWIQARIVEQFEFLDGFADDILRGRYGRPPTGGQYEQRVRQYARASRATYEAMRGRNAAEIGFDEERNRIAPGDSCKGCLAAERAGWVALGALVPVGSRDCRQNCRCVIRYRKSTSRRAAA